MDRFRRGLTSVLVSTTVIEVGVDVANATVMLIENAERFGLAQMHQLRGRIGRGEHKSYCILLTSDPSPETAAKLQVLEKTSNGFEVAEADWEMRGPGDLLGTAQSGLPALKFGNLRDDVKLMQQARERRQRRFSGRSGARSAGKSTFPRFGCRRRELFPRELMKNFLKFLLLVLRPERGRFAALRLPAASRPAQPNESHTAAGKIHPGGWSGGRSEGDREPRFVKR